MYEEEEDFSVDSGPLVKSRALDLLLTAFVLAALTAAVAGCALVLIFWMVGY